MLYDAGHFWLHTCRRLEEDDGCRLESLNLKLSADWTLCAVLSASSELFWGRRICLAMKKDVGRERRLLRPWNWRVELGCQTDETPFRHAPQGTTTYSSCFLDSETSPESSCSQDLHS